MHLYAKQNRSLVSASEHFVLSLFLPFRILWETECRINNKKAYLPVGRCQLSIAVLKALQVSKSRFSEDSEMKKAH